MTNSARKDEKLSELQTALQNLKESEIDCANSAAQYAELETIIRKQLKSQFIEVTESPNKTENDISCKTDCKSVSSSGSNSKYSSKSSNKIYMKYPEKVQKKNVESAESIISSEQTKKGQLLKRIRQCHESIDNVAILSEKIIKEKKKFLVRLDKMNREAWKSQKLKHPSIGKLEKHLSL